MGLHNGALLADPNLSTGGISRRSVFQPGAILCCRASSSVSCGGKEFTKHRAGFAPSQYHGLPRQSMGRQSQIVELGEPSSRRSLASALLTTTKIGGPVCSIFQFLLGAAQRRSLPLRDQGWSPPVVIIDEEDRIASSMRPLPAGANLVDEVSRAH